MDTPSATRRATKQDRIVGERIQKLRKSKGLSQTALGRAVGVTFQQIQKYENGMNRIGAGRLSEIAQMLEVPVSTLLDSDDGDAVEDGVAALSFLQAHGAVDLLRAYNAIDDDRMRREVLAIVRSIVRLQQAPGD
ncbi:helix-turn-helix transcriptional regulator [Methylorubrum podarium]|uniref:Helix-turn-helix transcriptional regulator n=1 Tax=Methylorubrum podarium TaxID=200476 RepID=A0ABV1QJV2_9HYPH